jgi:hypothetical protein
MNILGSIWLRAKRTHPLLSGKMASRWGWGDPSDLYVGHLRRWPGRLEVRSRGERISQCLLRKAILSTPDPVYFLLPLVALLEFTMETFSLESAL